VTGMRKGERVRCLCGDLLTVPERPVREARVLHCSACGGKLSAHATKCDYCGGEITLAEKGLGLACPECYSRLPLGAGYCSDCGLKIDPQVIRALPSSASCPRCKSNLVTKELAKGRYTECSGCGGIWLDASSFEKVIEEKDQAAVSQMVPVDRKGKPPVVPSSKVQYVPCPICGNIMHRRNFAGCSGTVIDWCKGHGYWFDPDELESIVSFIRSGGMDKARRMEIDRAKGEIRRLEDQKKSVARAGGLSMESRPQSVMGSGATIVDALFDLFNLFT
jgi:Zn-finger nucleic acid-binding protein